MSGTLPFGTDPYAPPVSPFATPANAAEGLVSPLTPSRTRSLLDMLTAFANGNAAANNQMARGFQQAGDQGAGFTGTGLRGDMADVTRGEQNLGPQAGIMKGVADIGPVAQSLMGFAQNAALGPVGAAIGIARSPAGLGLMSNIANYGSIAEKTAANAARGGPAMGGSKGGGDKPGGLSDQEAAAQAAAAAATNDMGGAKGGDSMGAGTAATGGAAPGTDNANSNSTAAGQDAAGPGDSTGLARGGLIELVGGGKVARGPGGGMDDLIPTTIEGQRAAALSDGEFVMPADVVAMMGDGSTNAGSQRLYDLVRQIREAKTGTGKQAEPLQFTDILRRTLG